MKMRNLMLGMIVAGLANAAAAAAIADRLEIGVTTKAGVPGRAEIQVDGPSKDSGYTEVTTKTLDYYVSVRGDVPDKAGNGGVGEIRLGDAETIVSVGEEWTRYKLSAPYTDPWSGGVVNEYVSPAKLCNQRLSALSGAARAAFVKKGTSFVHQNAYAISGSVSYYISKIGFDEIKRYTDAEMVPLQITCLALDRPRVRQDSHTKPAPGPTGQKMKPTISEVGLRIEPAAIVQDGKFLCPSKLKLYGTVDTIRKFYGQALFVGPHYLSNITVLNFQDKGHRNVVGTYNMDWHQMGGFATQPNAEPKKQKLTFRFNVADKDGKLLEFGRGDSGSQLQEDQGERAHCRRRQDGRARQLTSLKPAQGARSPWGRAFRFTSARAPAPGSRWRAHSAPCRSRQRCRQGR